MPLSVSLGGETTQWFGLKDGVVKKWLCGEIYLPLSASLGGETT